MKTTREGNFTKTKTKITATETTRKVEFEIPNHELDDTTAVLMKRNHQRGLYDDFFTLNQDFLSYVLTIGLSGKDWEVFVFFMSVMDYGNKILMNQETVMRNTGLSQSQVSRALTKLKKNKVILEKKLNTAKYEISFNYDIINPQMAFKGKATKERVKEHKALIEQESPYFKQYNLDGDIDLINGDGEVFKTIRSSDTEKKRHFEMKALAQMESPH